MTQTVQARLDAQSQKSLKRLTRELGMTSSEVIRTAIKALDAQHPPKKKPKFIGIGEFDSGIPDLATNKKYLEDFGR